jgi:hypothetical protein
VPRPLTNRPRTLSLNLDLVLVLLVSFLLSPATAAAQKGTITLRVEPLQVRVGDDIEVTVEASGSIDAIQAPAASGLPMESAGQSSSISLVNGNMSSQIEHHYRVVPDRAGDFTIGPALALMRGRAVARSETVKVKVNKAPKLRAISPEAQDLASFEGQAVFALAVVPKGEVVVGEAFQFSLELYIRKGLAVRGAELAKAPNLDGFKRENLLGKGRNRNPRRTIRIGGTLYDVHTQDRSLLIPLGPGVRSLGASEFVVQIASGFRARRKKVRTRPVRVRVSEPPSHGRPAGFVPGVVGRFALAGGPDLQSGRTLTVGERVLVDLHVSGVGNLDAVPQPSLNVPSGVRIETIPGRDCPDRAVGTEGIEGRCRFQTVISPEKPGELKLGPARLTYFNPANRTYRVASLGPWVLHVKGEARRAAGVADPGRAPAEDLGPIEPPFLDRAGPRPIAGRLPAPPSLWLGLGAPLLLLFFVHWAHAAVLRRRADPERARRQLVADAAVSLTSSRLAGVDLAAAAAEALRTVLVVCYEVDPRGVSMGALRNKLTESGVDAAVCDELTSVLEAADRARFAGGEGAEQLRDRSLTLVKTLGA